MAIATQKLTLAEFLVYQDGTVLPSEQWEALRNREAVISLDQSPPILVVEVVSDSTKSEDYRAKYLEYGVLEIAEYWIVDLLDQRLTICVFEDGGYTDRRLAGSDPVRSEIFPNLELTAAQVVAGRR